MCSRKEIAFSELASVSLFECLIVAGAPATGLLYDTAFKDGDRLQITLQRLRDMWQRADVLYIPEEDLDSLHRMECKSANGKETNISETMTIDTRKLSRYYIYLLFRYCISAAGPSACWPKQGSICNRLASHWGESKTTTHLLRDIPVSWLENKMCTTNYPSAPPSINNCPSSPPVTTQRLLSGVHRVQHKAQLTQPGLHQQHVPPHAHQWPPRDLNRPTPQELYPPKPQQYEEQHDEQPRLQQTNNIPSKCPQLYVQTQPHKAAKAKAHKKKSSFHKGCYDSNLESGEEY